MPIDFKSLHKLESVPGSLSSRTPSANETVQVLVKLRKGAKRPSFIKPRTSAQLPCLVVNIVRGGPGLGTIQPSQGDYFQAVKDGGHGDYHLIVLAPASVQEMADFVFEGFRLAEKYRNPAMILTDGALVR